MKFRSGDNPAAWNGALSHLLPAISKVQKIEHHKAVPYAEVPALMKQLMSNDSISAKALIFTILTGARTGETIGATWDEIDLGNKLWVIPAERMKAGREHRVPLCPRAIDLLKKLPRGTRHVFANPRTGRGAQQSRHAACCCVVCATTAPPCTASGRRSQPGRASRPTTPVRSSRPATTTAPAPHVPASRAHCRPGLSSHGGRRALDRALIVSADPCGAGDPQLVVPLQPGRREPVDGTRRG